MKKTKKSPKRYKKKYHKLKNQLSSVNLQACLEFLKQPVVLLDSFRIQPNPTLFSKNHNLKHLNNKPKHKNHNSPQLNPPLFQKNSKFQFSRNQLNLNKHQSFQSQANLKPASNHLFLSKVKPLWIRFQI